jgi:hypothetical protein
MRRIETLQAGEPALKLPGLSHSEGGAVDPAQQALLQKAQTGAPPPKLSVNTSDAGESKIPNGCLATCDAYEAHCVSECPSHLVECRHGCTRERAICLAGCH